MSGKVEFRHPVPCLWMNAGLLTYRLCDRDFDCDHCPLDAALRGRGTVGGHHRDLHCPLRYEPDFPDDRIYTAGHQWIQRVGRRGDAELLHCGVDVFAAAILGHCGGVHRECGNDQLEAGEVLCYIDFGLGSLPFRSPMRATVADWNAALCEQPERLVTSPYENGWIAELLVREAPVTEEFLSPQAAREQSHFDLKRFRRRMAMQTLADVNDALGPTLADGGEMVTDLRQMLGGAAYAQMLNELIH